MKNFFKQTRAGCSLSYPKILTFMKVYVLLFLLTIGNVMATGVYSQNARISLNLSGKTVADVLSEIEKKSEFNFVYNNKLIDVDRQVTIAVADEDINSILELLFNDTDVEYVVNDKHIILSNQLSEKKAQEQGVSVIKGKVTDENNRPVIGATVVVKGTTIGTITNVDGQYELPGVDQNAMLVFSFIGMKTNEVAVGGRETINVTLAEDVLGLEEVVANIVVPVRPGPTAVNKAAIGIFISATRRLDHPIQGDKFRNYKFSHIFLQLIKGNQ